MHKIQEIQGTGDWSPLAGQEVTIEGVVTAHERHGYIVQDPDPKGSAASCAIFIFTRDEFPIKGQEVTVSGVVDDYQNEATNHPLTQIRQRSVTQHNSEFRIVPEWFTREILEMSEAAQRIWLRSREFMLLGFPVESRFIAASNPFADYVAVPPDAVDLLNKYGGFIQDSKRPRLWFPCFKLVDRNNAPALNRGAILLTPVVGHLSFRSGGYQVRAHNDEMTVNNAPVQWSKSGILPTKNQLTVLTLNAFNLDPQIEREALVDDPRKDIDDDIGDGRFTALATAIVQQAGGPDIIAVQEIQGNNGAELSPNGPQGIVDEDLDASRTMGELSKIISEQTNGFSYESGDVAPTILGASGGQPNAEIRNAFFWNPKRLELMGAMHLLGSQADVFVGTRKPLVATFRFKLTGQIITIINIHAASRRNEVSPFAPDLETSGQPVANLENRRGYDANEEKRIAQARIVRVYLDELDTRNVRYFVTGDANAHQFSPSIKEMIADTRINLVDTLEPAEQFDYNHRGASQILTNGIVSKRNAASCVYEILHHSRLGAKPGQNGDMATDHDLAVAGFQMLG